MNMNATAQMVTTTQVGCGKAKPEPTVEWTARDFELLCESDAALRARQVNAALAAERSKPKGEKCPTCGYQLVVLDNNELAKLTEKAAYHELRQQLAAERETVKNLRIEAQQYKREIERLKDMITDYANDRPR